MIAYVDSSVVLRIAPGQPDALPERPSIQRGIASALHDRRPRTWERPRLRTPMADEEIALRRGTILENRLVARPNRRCQPATPASPGQTE
jgi:hypothetical protein